MTDTKASPDTDVKVISGHDGFKWIGKSVARKEDPALVTGRATYVGDVDLPGMLHAAVLGSPHSHARIVSIDTSRAKALPGVAAVLTGREATELIGPMTAFCAEPVPQDALAVDKVRYWGEPVVAVAATDRYVAEDALALVDIEWELLPPLVDMVEAMEPGAAKVHDTLDSNVVFHSDRSYGDVDADFARADRVIRTKARWHRMGAQPIETAGAVCSWDPFSRAMTIWSNTNFYNFLPWSFAAMLKIPTSRMRMIPCAVGGSFGSKHLTNKVLAIAGALTKATGKPVRYLEDRLENISANDNVGCDRLYEAELAVTDSGEMLSLRLHCIDDYGAYFQFGPGQHGGAMAQPVGPYRIGSLQYEVSAVLTNKVQQGFFRGAGADHGNFILERVVDAAADELGLDRAEIRRRNFIQPDQFPYRIPSGNVYDSGNYEGVLDRALALADIEYWRAEQKRARAEGRYIGIGLATCQERSAYNATEWWFLYDTPPLPATSTPESVKIDVDAFGGIRVELGCPVWGNSPQTVVAQVIAEEFGVDPSDVSVEHNDSTSGAISAGPGGSRLTVMLSGAARGASKVILEKMTRIAAHAMEANPEDVELVDGTFKVKGSPTEGLSLADVAMKAHLFVQTGPDGESSGLVATYTYDHPMASMPSDDRQDTGSFYPIVSHGCHIPIVEVDPETGIVRMLKYYAVKDCGTVMNPKLVEGQVVGGIVQGIGAAFMEEYRYDDQGALMSGSYREYLIPSVYEVPEIVVDHQETPSPVTEYGVKGAGEGGRLIAPAAIAAAVDDALKPFGVWIDELPMTPERLIEVLRLAEENGQSETQS